MAALDADLEDLEGSVRYVFLGLTCSNTQSGVSFWRGSRIVEETGGRLFGLEEKEVIERRKYVGRVRQEVEVGSLFHVLLLQDLPGHHATPEYAW